MTAAGEIDFQGTARGMGLRYLVPGVWWQPNRADVNARFKTVFRESWSLLPLGVRRRLRSYWRDCPTPALLVSPEVRVGDDWPGRAAGTLGEVRCRGGLIWFRTQAVKILPKRPLIGLIVHEMAHCYGHAEGLGGHRGYLKSEQWVAEDCVEDLLSMWDLIGYQDEQEKWFNGSAGAGARRILRR